MKPESASPEVFNAVLCWPQSSLMRPGSGCSLTSRPHARLSPLDRTTDLCFSLSRSVSPLGGWSIINRPASYSPLGPGHRSAAGGRRRFFGLSEAAEAEAEAAMLAEGGGGGGEKAAAPVRDEGMATSGAEKSGSAVGAGTGNPVIDAHRFLLSLRSDPMRAMLRSGKSSSEIGMRQTAPMVAGAPASAL